MKNLILLIGLFLVLSGCEKETVYCWECIRLEHNDALEDVVEFFGTEDEKDAFILVNSSKLYTIIPSDTTLMLVEHGMICRKKE